MSRSEIHHQAGTGGKVGETDAEELYRQGTEALQARNFAAAYRLLRGALDQKPSPEHLSQFALALAQYTGNDRAGVALCQEAIRSEPRNPNHFLRLGTIYLVSGRKKEAVRIFNLGLRVGRHAGITRILQALGQRDKPVLPFLDRTNPLNKYLGKMRNNFFKKDR